MDYEKRLEANIWKLKVNTVLSWFIVWVPIMVPFFISKGLSITGIFIIQSVFALTTLILEVPSGYYADIRGRKNTLVVGRLFATMGMLTYYVGTELWMFIMAAMFFGVGVAFGSGTNQAIYYESLYELGRGDEYVKQISKFSSYGRFSEALAAIVGGLVAYFALSLPYLITAALYFITFVVALTLVEPRTKRIESDYFTNLVKIFKDTLHYHGLLKWVVMYAVFLAVGTRIAAWLTQPLFSEAHIGIQWFGVLWAVMLFISGIVSYFAYKFDEKYHRKTLLVVLLVASIVAYLGMGMLPAVIGVFFIVIVAIARGLHDPIINHEINRMIEDERRATVFSIESMLHNLFYATFIPLIGAIATGDVRFAFVSLAVLIIAIPGYFLMQVLKNYSDEYSP